MITTVQSCYKRALSYYSSLQNEVSETEEGTESLEAKSAERTELGTVGITHGEHSSDKSDGAKTAEDMLWGVDESVKADKDSDSELCVFKCNRVNMRRIGATGVKDSTTTSGDVAAGLDDSVEGGRHIESREEVVMETISENSNMDTNDMKSRSKLGEVYSEDVADIKDATVIQTGDARQTGVSETAPGSRQDDVVRNVVSNVLDAVAAVDTMEVDNENDGGAVDT